MNSHATGPTLRRREVILRILRQTPVRSQEELREVLEARGFPVAQPTLSRDLRALGLVKSAAGYALPGETPAAFSDLGAERLDRVLREFLLSAEAAGNIVVLRTPPAAAQTVALTLDGASLREAVGTISGDDTVFVATRTPARASALARRLRTAILPERARTTRA